MKKLLVIIVAALALAACTQEKNIVPAEPGVTEITATHQLSTRSALYASDGETLYNILWDAPDKIMVGYAGTELASFTSKNESPAAEATFTGKLPEGSGSLYGIYPAEDGNSVDADGKYRIQLHVEQTAVEGSYDPLAFPAVAQSDSKNLAFLNVFGLLELSVGYDDVTAISYGIYYDDSFVFERTRKSASSLVMLIEIKNGVPQMVGSEGEASVDAFILYPPKGSECFSKEAIYYMAVPPIGGWISGIHPAFWLTHSDGSTTEIVFENNPIVERSKVHPVKRLFLEEEPEVPEAEAIFLDGNKTISVGESITLVPTINPSNATPVLVWSSDDPETVSVTQEGVITGQKTGRTLVTVTVEGSDPDLQPDLTVSIYVTVIEPDPYNGHEYVDLGLPSGLKWATCNVGAENPEDYGDYFAWGETEPKEDYTWATYKWIKDGKIEWQFINKYTIDDGQVKFGVSWYDAAGEFCGDNKTVLERGEKEGETIDDAARKNWGGIWRMPTTADFRELIDKTDNDWTENYNNTGKAGYIFTSKTDATKSIFLPAAGYRNETDLLKNGGYYWCASLSDYASDDAEYYFFDSSDFFFLGCIRLVGFSVRPIAP